MLILTHLNGSHASHQHTIRGDQPQILGRHARDIRLDDSRISRRHAMVQHEGQRWLLIDLGSSNGTYLNDQRIPGPAELKHGDHIRMGRLLLEVTMEPVPVVVEEEPEVPLTEEEAWADVTAPQENVPAAEQEAEAEQDPALWDSGSPIESAILPPDKSDVELPDLGPDEPMTQAIESLADPLDPPTDVTKEPNDQATQLRHWVEQTSEPAEPEPPEPPESPDILLAPPIEAAESIPEFIDIAPMVPDVDPQDDFEAEEASLSDRPTVPPVSELEPLEEEPAVIAALPEQEVPQTLDEDEPAPPPLSPLPIETVNQPPSPTEVPNRPTPVVTTPSQAMVPEHPPHRRPVVLLMGLLALAIMGVGTWYVYPLMPFAQAGQFQAPLVAVSESSPAPPNEVPQPQRVTLKTLQHHVSEAPPTPNPSASPPPPALVAPKPTAVDTTFEDGPPVIGRLALASRIPIASPASARATQAVVVAPATAPPTLTPAPKPKPSATHPPLSSSPVSLAAAPSLKGPASTPAATPQAISRTVYLVDASGSLIDTFSQVIAHLSQQIRQLSPNQQFTVIFFRQNNLLEVPPAGLKSATRRTVSQTLRWASTESGHVWPQGRSDITEALALALSYHPTNICILSDNAINRRTADADPDAALHAIHTMLAQVPTDAMPRIDTVQFIYDDPGNVLQQLAQAYEGQFRFIAPPSSSDAFAPPLQTMLQATP